MHGSRYNLDFVPQVSSLIKQHMGAGVTQQIRPQPDIAPCRNGVSGRRNYNVINKVRTCEASKFDSISNRTSDKDIK